MPESSEVNRLDELLARLVDETINSEEFAELEILLDGDLPAQQRYLNYLGLHRDLEASSLSKEEKLSTKQPLRFSGYSALAMAAMAAVLVMVVSMLLEPQEQGPIARVVDLEGPIAWTEEGSNNIHHLEVGSKLQAGRLESFAAGTWVKVEFNDGTSLALSGYSVVRISDRENGKWLDIEKGDFSFDVVPQPKGKPLRLITPTAEAEVVGTQFNVQANVNSTRLTVNEGKVRVKRLADGSVKEVPADHLVIAALEVDTSFVVKRRSKNAESWKAKFPRDILAGEWRAEEEPNGLVKARPHIYKGDWAGPEPPVLLHSVVLDPSAGNRSPLVLFAGSRVRVHGRIKTAYKIHLGLRVAKPRGGFSGKYQIDNGRMIHPDAEGKFVIELDLRDFTRRRERFPVSPLGHEMAYFWIQTVRKDVGLSVESVELSK